MRRTVISCAAGVLMAGFAPPSNAQVLQSSAGTIAVDTVARGLDHPWALAFLPDGRMLVTERPGRMRIVATDRNPSPALGGVPKVFSSGQGGLLDLVLDRGYAQNQTVYFCYAEPVSGGARTALARARLVDEGTPRLDDVKVIFRQEGGLSSSNHFGCRIAQTAENDLFVTTGDHFTGRDKAQNLGNHLGKIIRIRPDGSVPPDNPYAGRSGAKAEIWSFGHRNPQGLALHPVTGKLWEHEHGPRGGDEVNVIEKGKELRMAGDRTRHRLQRRKDSCEQPAGRHGAAELALGAVDCTIRDDILYREPVSGVAWPSVRRCLGEQNSGAARARRGENNEGRTPGYARTHP